MIIFDGYCRKATQILVKMEATAVCLVVAIPASVWWDILATLVMTANITCKNGRTCEDQLIQVNTFVCNCADG